MTRGEYYSDEKMPLQHSWRGRDDLLRVVLFNANAGATHALLEKGTIIPQDGTDSTHEFAGGHPGMPKNDVWEMTFVDEPIEPFVPGIVSDVQLVIMGVTRLKT